MTLPPVDVSSVPAVACGAGLATGGAGWLVAADSVGAGLLADAGEAVGASLGVGASDAVGVGVGVGGVDDTVGSGRTLILAAGATSC